MAIKKFGEKIILIILTISILLSFVATPVSNAGLGLKEGEFYYSGTTKGTYVVSEGIFSWLIDNLGKIADWIFGIITMGVRMVFVGWAALIEKLLTWSLETTAGMDNNGGLVVDSSDVTAIGDSSGNITVQAIVYNQVPLFDINFFKLETDKTLSGTGQVLKCKTCGRTCEECCTITEAENPQDTTSTCASDCDCNGCESCQRYLANWQMEKPLVIQIREFVAMWYTIIRLLAMAAMLVVLLVVGLKMMLSTIASEKAVYKRMLVDWVVGMIILFSMHYLIFFIITINETLVNTVKETANSINKTQIQFVNAGKKGEEEGTQEVSDQEVEISLYEEIRTRAYDARLSVGLSGMIMYITLIYFAIRYSIVYLKRYLTVIVLALMAPPLGVSYALQKVLTGKSSSMKTWMTEFVMTVIIQIVHALIYAVFISTALALSLQSVAGMIVALIFMNFALKAEKMFRQIFKMGDGDSLAGRMAESGDSDKIQSQIKAATGLAMAAKPIANTMMNTPLAKGVKTIGKVGLAGVGGLATGGMALGGAAINALKGNNEDNNGEAGTTDTSEGRGPSSNPPEDNGGGSDTDISEDTDAAADSSSVSMQEEKDQQALIAEGGDSLRMKAAEATNILKDPNATSEQKASAQRDIDNYFKYQLLMRSEDGEKKQPLDANISSLGIFGAHLKKAVNITNHYKTEAGYGGKLSQGYRAIFGTKHYDRKTGKMVYDGNGYFRQFNSSNLFGLSKEDKKFLKTEAMKPLIGIAGAVGMFGGLMTMVAYPAQGGAAFVYGAHKYNQGFKQPAGERGYKGRYRKAKYPAATMQTAQQNLLKQAYSEIAINQQILDSEMVSNVRDKHPDLYNSIMDDLRSGSAYSGIKIDGGIKSFAKKAGRGISSTFSAATFGPKKFARVSGLFNSSAFGDSMYMIDRYALARDRKETETFEKEASRTLKIAHQKEMEELVKKQDEILVEDATTQERMFLEELSEEHQIGESDEDFKERQSKLQEYIENCEQLGYTYNKKTRKLERTAGSIKKTSFSGAVDDSKAQGIEKTIDIVMQDMYKISGQIDTSETGINKALQLVSSRLKSEGLLDKKHSIEVLFRDRQTARKVLKDKAKGFNSQAKISSAEESSREKLDETISKQRGFSEKEQKLIQQIVLEGGIQGADATRIMDKVSERIGMTDQGKKQPVSKHSRSKGIHKTKTDLRRERKDKIKAIDEFLKIAETMQAPQATAEEVSKSAVQSIITAEDRERVKGKAVKKSHAKFKKVLQFVEESGDQSLAELVDTTEEKIRGSKQGKQIDGQDFSKAEAETLQLLFNKMKEELVFNEFTKNVLDQKDSDATKKAKAKLYAAREEYLIEQRELLVNDNFISQNTQYGVDAGNVGTLVSSGVTSFVDSLGDTKIQDILNKNKGIAREIQGREFKDLDVVEQSKVKNKVTDFLDHNLIGLEDLKKSKKRMHSATKKSLITGKIDVYKQLDDLL